MPRMVETPSAAAANATSAGNRSGEFVASKVKASKGLCATVIAPSSMIIEAPARSNALHTNVSAWRESVEILRTVTSPAIAAATMMNAAALQSLSMV